MSKVRFSVILSAVAVCGAAFMGFELYQSKRSPTVVVDNSIAEMSTRAMQEQLAALKAKEDESNRLGQYVINMMYWCGAKDKLSDGNKQVLASDIVEVSNAIFEKEDTKKAFVAVIAIESCFQRFAQSPTGPKGYAQLAKVSFHEALGDCGINNLKDDDVWNTKLNLYAGACYFRKVLERFNGDTYAAIVAYNQGPNSEAAKTYAKHGWMDNTEALKYVARFSFLDRKVTDKQEPGVPAIQELKKVTDTKK
jgi:Transglycosylase SLT domain